MTNRLICLTFLVVTISGCQRSDDKSTADAADPGEARSNVSAIPIAHAEPADLVDLRLRVEPGDRFPLIKTVRQSILQQSNSGEATADTELELHLVLKVESADEQSVVFHVQYSRVRFIQDGQGRRAVYDSAQPPARIPFAAVPYAGLVGNGYSVRVGRDNQIKELIGHDDFMERCIAGIPSERRQNLMNEIAVRFGDEGVAGFIPDTIGLLPFDADAKAEIASRVQEGDSWKYERNLMQPIPVHLKSTCRVVRVSQNQAEIDIAGRVTTGRTYATPQQTDAGAVNIRGGSTMGVCIVDRRTGLPIDVQRTELLQVEVSAPDGTEVRQDKRIETSVRLFPTERGPIVRSTASPTTVQPASARGISRTNTADSIPTQVRSVK